MRFVIVTALLFAVVAVLSAVLTRVAISYLRRRAMVDRPNDRSSHTVPTLRGGGLGLMAALLPVWIWITAQAGRLGDPSQLLLIVGAAALMAISWLDDRRGLGPAPRFFTQIAVIAAVMAFLPPTLSLSGGLLPLSLDRLIAGLLWAWFVNLFNFMDGIDGIAGGSAAAMAVGLTLVALWRGPDQLEAVRSAMIAAAALGFLAWNWHPAKVFLGDVGSVPLGFLLGYELIRLAMDAGQPMALIIPLYYLADATLTLIRRALRGERVWRAHREHFYQRAVQNGRGHAQVARVAMRVQLGLAVLALLAVRLGWWMAVPAVLLVTWLLLWMAKPARTA